MINRRAFLLHSAALTTTLAASPRAWTQITTDSLTDYRALVCVFLLGGNDSFNMVVPNSSAEHKSYTDARQNLAIDRSALLPINPLNVPNPHYGFHPAMQDMQRLFDAGHLAVVANVGPLIVPTTQAQYRARAVPLPPYLFSHDSQQNQWQTLRGITLAHSGWAGRIADVLQPQLTHQPIAMNISLAGNSMALSSNHHLPMIMGPTGPVPIAGLSGNQTALEQRRVLDAFVDYDHANIYARAFASVQRRAIDTAASVRSAILQSKPITTAFPNSTLGKQLKTTAQLIAARDALNSKRQIFYIAVGGFDTHGNQQILQPQLLSSLSAALKAFYDATVELGIAEDVTTFTHSDFGRTLTSNGDGTDHGWGSLQLVLGNAVRGRTFYGTMPSLSLGSADDVGGGRILPTLSVDQYVATLAQWFGVQTADLTQIAPNLGNFAQRNLGFMY